MMHLARLFLIIFLSLPLASGEDNDLGHSEIEMKGWTIHLSRELSNSLPNETARMLEIMEGQLERVVDAVPKKALVDLQKVPIWINPTYPNARPKCEYHPNPKWLSENGRDPGMGKAIEVTNTQIFPFENRRMPYLMLHELAHAFHDQVLGFNQAEIMAAFERARDSGSYDKVERTDGVNFSTGKAYAMSNHKEYFAELTEAFFGRNDFFPFDRAELTAHDPKGLEVIARAWGAN